MKYSELEKMLKRMGCFDTGESFFGHPKWYCPSTKTFFAMSHHHSEEVAIGTLMKIFKAVGLR